MPLNLQLPLTISYRNTSKKDILINKPDDELKCAICLGVAQDPQQHGECGKLFCKKCIERHGKDKPCPHCKTQGGTFFPDKRGN